MINYKLVLIVLLLVIYGAADGVKDATIFHPDSFKKYDWSAQYWNNSSNCSEDVVLGSWRNKYAQDEEGNLIAYESKWYHIGKKPAYKEAFIFSSTALVFLTDGFHLMQFIQLWAFALILVLVWLYLYGWIITAIKKTIVAISRLSLCIFPESIIKVITTQLSYSKRKVFIISCIILFGSRILIAIGFYLTYNLLL